jgi:hypothetical protein
VRILEPKALPSLVYSRITSYYSSRSIGIRLSTPLFSIEGVDMLVVAFFSLGFFASRVSPSSNLAFFLFKAFRGLVGFFNISTATLILINRS